MEEQLMVCNEAGEEQFLASRSIVHEFGYWHKVVHGWFYDHDYLYVQQRSFQKKAFPGCFDISVAGHIDPKETAMEALLREMEEELGINLSSSDFQHIGTYREIMYHGPLIDRELADVYIAPYANQSLHLKEEAIDFGFISMTSLLEGLHNTIDMLSFTSILSRQTINIPTKEFFIHELDYYIWLIHHILQQTS